MDWNAYQDAAARTINPGQSYEGNLDNFALGLAGEAGEVAELVAQWCRLGFNRVLRAPGDHAPGDHDAFVKELGDVLWYVAGSCTIHNVRVADLEAPDIEPRVTPCYILALEMAGHAGKAADHVKKFLYHGRLLSTINFLAQVGSVRAYVQALGAYVGAEIDEIAETNIAKLLARHPDGFKREQAPA